MGQKATPVGPAANLPQETADLVHLARETVRHARNLTLMKEMAVKRAPRGALPPGEAFGRDKQVFAPGTDVKAHQQLMMSQLVADEASAFVFHEVHPGAQVELRAPKTVGLAAEAQPLFGRSRRVFVACLPNATAFAGTSTIRLRDGSFAFDVQTVEAGRLPVDSTFDPLVFAQDGEQLTMIDDRRETTRIHLPEALSLLGCDSVSFGHWMAEELLRFLTARRISQAARVPVLIDARMPPQHRESILAFTGPDHPVIEVPRHMRVEADRLWIVSNWLYSPKQLTTDRGIDADALVHAPGPIAEVLRAGWEELDARLGLTGSRGGRVFVARDPDRHRGLVNHGEIVSLLVARGYPEVRPETLSFVEQSAPYRAADSIVVQSGSAAAGLIMCRPGTQVCSMSHGATSLAGLWSGLLEELGVGCTIVVGETAERHADYADKSSYRIDPGLLEETLDRMEMERGDA